MTLYAGAPDWVVELGVIAGVMQESIASTGAVGEVHVRPSLPEPTHLTVTAGWHYGDGREAAWSVAMMVAGMWPTWLGQYGLGLEVVIAGERRRADCELMMAVAEGTVTRPEWLMASRGR